MKKKTTKAKKKKEEEEKKKTKEKKKKEKKKKRMKKKGQELTKPGSVMASETGVDACVSCPRLARRARHPVRSRRVPLNTDTVLFFFFFFTLVTCPRRSLSLKLSETRVYEP